MSGRAGAAGRGAAGGRAADVAIIGGGIVGTSLAAMLAAEGALVVLFEREAIGAGASGRNSGIVQHPLDPVLSRLHLDSLEPYRRLAAADVGFTLPAEPAGLVLVSHHPDVVRRATGELALTHPELDPTFLDAGELQRLDPAMGPDVAGCRLHIGYPVRPASATAAYARLAERSGARIVIGEATVGVVDGRAVGVVVDGAAVPAGRVVVAAGPWTPALVDPTGGWQPIRRLWGVVADVVLERPPVHVLEEAEIDSAIEPGVGDPVDAHDVDFSLVTAEGVSALGSTFLDDEPEPAAWVDRLVARGASFVPGIASAPIRGTRRCARPLSFDGRPLVGAVPWIDDLYVVAGHGPWGISTGPGSAALVADLVLDRPRSIPASLDPARFLVEGRSGGQYQPLLKR